MGHFVCFLSLAVSFVLSHSARVDAVRVKKRRAAHATNAGQRESTALHDTRQTVLQQAGDEDVILREIQSWIFGEYSAAVTAYKANDTISDSLVEEISAITTAIADSCRAYLEKEKGLIQDGEGGAERMLSQYLSEVKTDLKKTGLKKHAFRAGHNVLPKQVISASVYVEKKLKKILLKLQTLLVALESHAENILQRGSPDGEGWIDGQAPIEIASPLQYPFHGGPTEFLYSAYGRASVLKTVQAWPIIPRNRLHLVYHGSGSLPRKTAGEYISCGAYDFLAHQGHGFFVDADPMHAPLDFLVGSQFGVGDRFRNEEVGYIWEIEAVDFAGRPKGIRFPNQCRPDPVKPTGIGSTANSLGWMRMTMHTPEDMQQVDYYDRRGICKCRLRINNVFAVNRWMRSIIIDYHKGTNACTKEKRCPKNMVGTWD